MKGMLAFFKMSVMKRGIFFVCIFCSMDMLESFSQARPIDKNATRETKDLFKALYKIQKTGTIFGHQHATEYGRGWSGDADRSDVKSVTGSHPGVIGIDFSGFLGANAANYKVKLRQIVQQHYAQGGVITIAWHFNNPLGPGGFYWKDSLSTPVVSRLIPGGDSHELYKNILADIADWVKSCKGPNGEAIPMIFRPYHEFDGNWFWWGAGHCSVEEFISIWRFTVDYLKDVHQVHNLLYAFSPDNKFLTEAKFLERYPGNSYVDMVGMDNYGDMGRNGYNLPKAIEKLLIISNYAKKNNKLAAFTETGLETIPNPNWWTDVLLKVMKTEGLNVSYVLVWRNDIRSPTHYYAPFPGQVSVPDFMKFYEDPFTLFLEDLRKQNIYRFKNN
jgi:mannan endo-1,4-beta-mannosidase